jgi:hypothetical protein
MDGEIAEHNNIMLAKIIILYEKQLELEELYPDRDLREKNIQLAIDCLSALITKYKQKIVRDDK